VKLGIAVLLAALLFASQLLLPGVAERQLRDELADTGAVTSVSVHAFPALKLLGKKADSVRVRMSQARIGSGDLADELDSTRRTGSLDVRVDRFSLGPLSLRDVRLRKDGDALTGEASLTTADLAAALPVDLGLHPVASEDGALVMEAQVGPVTVRARLSASDGALLIAPDGLLGGLASVTVFDDPRVRVLSVGARSRADGFTVVTKARLS
jgi:hypothetical protein